MLDAQLVSPFVDAAVEVFDEAAGLTISKGSMSVKTCAVTTQEISVYVGMSGGVYGQILYGMSARTAKQVAATMIGQRVRILNDFAQSAIGELGNMITGHAAAKLEALYPHLNITPPTLIVGKDVLISGAAIRRLCIMFASEVGGIEVNIAIETHRIPDTVKIIYMGEAKTSLLI